MRIGPGGSPIAAPSSASENTAWQRAAQAAQRHHSSSSPRPANPGVPQPAKFYAPSGASNLPDLKYMGGRVLSAPKIYNVYVGSYFKTQGGQKEIQYNDGFARQFDTPSSSLFRTLRQYNVGPSSFGGSTVIAKNSPLGVKSTSVMTGRDVQNYVKEAIASKAVPYDPQGIYNVVPPPNVKITGDGAGYHGSFREPANPPATDPPATNTRVVYYAVTVDPHPTSAGQQQGIPEVNAAIKNPLQIRTVYESHELAETITDPNVSFYPRMKLGWYSNPDPDDNRSPLNGEIGDLAINSLPASQFSQMDSAGYREQLMWSNLDKVYEIAPGTPRPTPVLGSWHPPEVHPRRNNP